MEVLERRVLSVDDVSKLTGMSPNAVRHAARVGRIPARKWPAQPGSTVTSWKLVFLAEEIEAFLANLPGMGE